MNSQHITPTQLTAARALVAQFLDDNRLEQQPVTEVLAWALVLEQEAGRLRALAQRISYLAAEEQTGWVKGD